MTVTRSQFRGAGSYLPERIMTNDELSTLVDTSDEWITSRSGIKTRHIAADGELTSDLAVKAADAALRNAGLGASDIDMVLVATATPDETFPATATKVQAALGITGGAAFDLQAVCSGFVYGLGTADGLIRGDMADRVLLIGAETFSRIIDWTDRGTCVLFGDGAGAVVLERGEGQGSNDDRGILGSVLRSDGRLHDLLYVDGGVSSTQTAGHLRMQGKDVFRNAVQNLHQIAEQVLEKTGLQSSDIDWIVPHQANKRIIDRTVSSLGLDHDKVIYTVQDHGNTSAASVPLALAQAVDDGRIKPGHIILFEAMGGGLTWGATIGRW